MYVYVNTAERVVHKSVKFSNQAEVFGDWITVELVLENKKLLNIN